MGGMGGGSEQKTSSSTTEPPDFIKPFLVEGTQNLYNVWKAHNAPEYYGGQTYADFSPQTQGAIDMITGRAQAGSPIVDAAGRSLTDTLSGQYLDPSTNPQFQAALEAGFRPQTEQFLNQVIPGITSAFTGSGRTGSGAHASVVNDATAGLSRAQADAAAKAGAQHYGTERANMFTAAGMAPTIAAQDYIDAQQLSQAGGMVDQQSQRAIDADVARYNYDQNKEWDYVNRYLASMNAAYPGGQSSGTTSGGSSGSAMGGISSILGMGMTLAPLLMASDERLKEDIEPVGSLNDGQTVYSYRYRGDPTPRIGLMAQEVAQVHPEAVGVMPSGYLGVDYDAATRESRGLF